MFYSVGKWGFAAGVIVAMFFSMSQTALSQQPGQMQQKQTIEVSDQELEKFMAVQGKMVTIQDSARQKMITAIEDVGLDLDTFNQTVEQMQSAESMDEVDASERQVQQVQEASREIQTIQNSLQQEVYKVMAEEEMSPDRFGEIRQAAIQDPELQQRMQQIEQKKK
ncbi:MAG: DUF4168 domain-containing protein [bacterium]